MLVLHRATFITPLYFVPESFASTFIAHLESCEQTYAVGYYFIVPINVSDYGNKF